MLTFKQLDALPLSEKKTKCKINPKLADLKETESDETVAEGSMKQARKNVGASTCWDGYKAKGTKKKGGKVVPNCVKEEEIDEMNTELSSIKQKYKGKMTKSSVVKRLKDKGESKREFRNSYKKDIDGGYVGPHKPSKSNLKTALKKQNEEVVDEGYGSYEKGGEVKSKKVSLLDKLLKRKKPERKAQKATDAGARAKRLLQRKIHAKYVSGSTENVPDSMREGVLAAIKPLAKAAAVGAAQQAGANAVAPKKKKKEEGERKDPDVATESVVREAKVDQKLPDYKRATARDKRYGNPHGSHELGGGIRKDRRDDHEKRRGVKEEAKLEEAKRSLADRMDRKSKLMKKTVRKAMDFARDEGEASGHARFNMSRLGREKDKLAAKRRETNEAKVDQGRSDYGKASIRNYRRKGPGHGEPAMFDPDNKRGKLIDKRREEHKERRGVKGAKVPAYKREEVIHSTSSDDTYASQEKISEKRTEESRTENLLTFKEATRLKKEKGYNKGGSDDKALNFVKTKIRKEYGKPAGQQKKVKGAKSDAGTGKYKKKADDKKAYAAKAKKAGFKSTQSYTDTMARYGGESNYKKGRGLGS